LINDLFMSVECICILVHRHNQAFFIVYFGVFIA